MNKHLLHFRKIVQARLDIDITRRTIIRLALTNFLDFRKIVQARLDIDITRRTMIRLVLTVLDPDYTSSVDPAMLNTVGSLSLASCKLWQSDGLLESQGPCVPSVLCRFDVLAGHLFVLFAGVVGCEAHHSDGQVNGHQRVHC